MTKYVLLVLCIAGLHLVGTAQERSKPKAPPSFVATLEKVKKDWAAENYGACMRNLQIRSKLVIAKRTEVLRAALPAAPEGWKIRKEDSPEKMLDNPAIAVLSAGVGNLLERHYQQVDGPGSVDVSVMVDSPVVQMLSIMFANPAAAGPNAEKIGYGAHKGLLQPEGRSLSLQILIAEKHVVDVTLRPPRGMETGAAEDWLFALFDQAAVDRIAAALAR